MSRTGQPSTAPGRAEAGRKRLRVSLGLLMGCLTAVIATQGTSWPQRKAPQCTIVVNKANNSLKLFENGVCTRRYRVATGRNRSTVVGTFRVTDKCVVSRTGRGPLGTHWLGLNTLGARHRKQVGLHGTNDPDCIGTYASLGCIRLLNRDISELYAAVPVGTKVVIADVPVEAPKPVPSVGASKPTTPAQIAGVPPPRPASVENPKPVEAGRTLPVAVSQGPDDPSVALRGAAVSGVVVMALALALTAVVALRRNRNDETSSCPGAED